MTPTTPPPTIRAQPEKELRLALVCYGGVSLAIYMHGIAKELQSLVAASRAFQRDPTRHEFPEGSTESFYWRALEDSWRRTGVRTRVVIDVIAGTSAGGINGIFLAKGLAANRSQDELTKLWLERVSIWRLGGRLRIIGRVAGLFLRGRPPLGQPLLGWLVEALEKVDAAPPALDGEDSLVADGQPLQLFVTTTDFFGRRQSMVIHDPPEVSERRHRHVFRFAHRDPSYRGLSSSAHPALALAARATSSFPGAFAPVKLEDLAQTPGLSRDQIEQLAGEQFPAYALERETALDSLFVDGGLLDNRPFAYAIDTVARRPADLQVDRRLIYIEPDPGESPQGGAPSRRRDPGLGRSIWASLSGIPSYEPILDDVERTLAFNDKVREIDELVEASATEVWELIQGLDPPRPDASESEIREFRTRINRLAEERTGIAWVTHFALRVDSVIDQFGTVAHRLAGYPEASYATAFTRRVAREWARSRGLVAPGGDRDKQRELLQAFDLGYTRRRIQFVLRGLNLLYAEIDGETLPGRTELDAAKKRLWSRVLELRGLISGSALPAAIGDGVREVFPPGRDPSVRDGARVDPAAFAAEHAERFDRIRADLEELLTDKLETLRHALFQDFQSITAGWRPAARRAVLQRYLGFAFWDVQIYPLLVTSERGELDEVEILRMSPEESTLLDPPDWDPKRASRTEGKLEGVGLGHFRAFLRRRFRENDYLWGRLDAVERLLRIVDPAAGAAAVRPAFAAVLAQEKQRLKKVRKLIRKLEEAL